MSSAELDISHLTQKVLSPEDKKILEGLEDWLSSAEFDSRTNNCVDKSLSEKWTLLEKMDLIKNFTRPVYQIRRVPAHGPPKPFNTQGPPNAKAPHSMTVMRVIEGNPTVSGEDAKQEQKILPMDFGWTTYITKKVEVTPAADILFVTSLPE